MVKESTDEGFNKVKAVSSLQLIFSVLTHHNFAFDFFPVQWVAYVHFEVIACAYPLFYQHIIVR